MILIVIVSLLCQVFGEPLPIVKGHESNIVFHPWLVSIQKHGYHHCGGSIISDSIILTACHCISDYPLDSLLVRLDSSRTDSGGSCHSVVTIKPHENCTKTFHLFQNDLGLVKVSPRISFNAPYRIVSKIRLAGKWDVIIPGTGASVAGWGAESKLDYSVPDVRRTFLRIVDSQECKESWGDKSGIEIGISNQICATGVEVGSDVCYGDSGTPLVVNNVQYGIAVYSSCGNTRHPAAIYTNISYYRDWIDENSKRLMYNI